MPQLWSCSRTPVSQLTSQVEDAAGQDLVPGIVADALPAADDVVAIGDGAEKTGNLGGIVLQVGVEGQDHVAAGRVEAGGQGRRLAEVAAKADAVHLRYLAARLAISRHEPSRLPSSTKMTSMSRLAGGPSRRSR